MFQPSIPLQAASESRFYRIELEAANASPMAFFMQWQVAEVAFYNQNQRVEIGGPYRFTSAWMSAGLGEEWVYVDLGARCEFDRGRSIGSPVRRRALSRSPMTQRVGGIFNRCPPGPGSRDDLKLAQPIQGRYVRVLMTRPTSADGYMLSEMEVYGRGGFVRATEARARKPAWRAT